MNFFEYHASMIKAGPYYIGEEKLSLDAPMQSEVRFIAYYLPQFHRIDENDRFWGKGFTEWSNVARATPRYQGHQQPRLPDDLGFYDLSSIECLKKQVNLAKRGGIYGFCFHYYWFSGRQVLEKPLQNLMADVAIDLPFCINWANENWTRRWDGADHDVLLGQEYLPDDAEKLAEVLVPIFKDPRYIHVDGRPLMMIYRPHLIPMIGNFLLTIELRLAKEGICKPFIIMPDADGNDPLEIMVDGVAGFPPHPFSSYVGNIRNWLRLYDREFIGRVLEYETAIQLALKRMTIGEDYFPGVCPGWDNEARRPRRGFSLYGSTPEKYKRWLSLAASHVLSRSLDRRLIFINAWNEWGEGAYLEPDRHLGYAYLVKTREVLDAIADDTLKTNPIDRLTLQKSYLNFIAAKINSLRRRACAAYLGLRSREP